MSLKKNTENEDLIIITDSGMTIRISADQISSLSRNTQGVRLINLKNNQKVSATAIIQKEEESNETEMNDQITESEISNEITSEEN